MHQDDAIRALRGLGLDEAMPGAVALLPLLQVAWADGRIDPYERAVLAAIIEERRLPTDILDQPPFDGWVATLPRHSVFAAGRELLVRLVHRPAGHGPRLPAAALERLAEDCMRVARASGGPAGREHIGTAERQVMKQLCHGITRDLASLDLPAMPVCLEWLTTLSGLDGAA